MMSLHSCFFFLFIIWVFVLASVRFFTKYRIYFLFVLLYRLIDDDKNISVGILSGCADAFKNNYFEWYTHTPLFIGQSRFFCLILTAIQVFVEFETFDIYYNHEFYYYISIDKKRGYGTSFHDETENVTEREACARIDVLARTACDPAQPQHSCTDAIIYRHLFLLLSSSLSLSLSLFGSASGYVFVSYFTAFDDAFISFFFVLYHLLCLPSDFWWRFFYLL